jgi:uncharacterized membrane protein YgcG
MHKALLRNTEVDNSQNTQQREAWWYRLQRGQALVEYWPTLPAAVMVMIVAGAMAGPIGRIFHQTADALNLVVCGQGAPAYFTLPIGQVVEILGSEYDSENNRSTFTLSVPGDSRVILGLSEEDAQRIAQASQSYTDYQQDTTTSKWGVSFEPENNTGITTSDGREITMTLTGQVDFVNNLEVTVIDSSNNVTSGHVYTTISYTGEDCANQTNQPVTTTSNEESNDESRDKTNNRKGNNGVGNGYDDQPPGNPPENDTCDTAAPGSPCNQGGVNNTNGNSGNTSNSNSGNTTTNSGNSGNSGNGGGNGNSGGNGNNRNN